MDTRRFMCGDSFLARPRAFIPIVNYQSERVTEWHIGGKKLETLMKLFRNSPDGLPDLRLRCSNTVYQQYIIEPLPRIPQWKVWGPQKREQVIRDAEELYNRGPGWAGYFCTGQVFPEPPVYDPLGARIGLLMESDILVERLVSLENRSGS